MKLVSNCPLCGEKGLHVHGNDDLQIQQCISCGYSTTSKFKGTKKENQEYKKLNSDMKKWSKVKNGNIWIPSMLTLPFGMLYPFNNDEGDMKWGFAPMIDIPKEEQEKYPKETGDGFYDRKYDTDNPKVFDEFIFAMAELNEKAKRFK